METLTFTDKMTVELITSNVSDALVTQAARVSTKGAESRDDEANKGLISYLLRNKHWSPFGHGSFTFFVHAPIFVMREFMRHSSWDFNEESSRYKRLDPVFYAPNAGRPLIQTGKASQYTLGCGSEEQYQSVRHNLESVYRASYAAYMRMLEEGAAREVARMCLPVGIYSSCYATCSPRSLMHFLDLRLDATAQEEIRMVAHKMATILETEMPETFVAWQKTKE